MGSYPKAAKLRTQSWIPPVKPPLASYTSQTLDTFAVSVHPGVHPAGQRALPALQRPTERLRKAASVPVSSALGRSDFPSKTSSQSLSTEAVDETKVSHSRAIWHPSGKETGFKEAM